MRQIDEEKYHKEFSRVRLKFRMSFFGHSEQMLCHIVWNEKEQDYKQLSDEQLMIVAQLLGKARDPLVMELRRRDLLPSQEQVNPKEKSGKRLTKQEAAKQQQTKQ